MDVKQKLDLFIKKLKARYMDNLAGVIVFGSIPESIFIDGESDIDSIILVKKCFDVEAEKKILKRELIGLDVTIHGFNTLKGEEKYVKDKLSWSTFITLIRPPMLIYATPEFKELQVNLHQFAGEYKKNNEHLMNIIKEKDVFELGPNFLEKAIGYKKTSCFYGHFRRKFQILSYFLKNKLEYSYEKTLENVKEIFDEEDYKSLMILSDGYKERKAISPEEEDYFKKLSLKTSKIMETALKENI